MRPDLWFNWGKNWYDTSHSLWGKNLCLHVYHNKYVHVDLGFNQKGGTAKTILYLSTIKCLDITGSQCKEKRLPTLYSRKLIWSGDFHENKIFANSTDSE